MNRRFSFVHEGITNWSDVIQRCNGSVIDIVELDLHSNSISSCIGPIFVNLQFLNLSSNELTIINATFFNFFPNIVSIDLSSNMISRFETPMNSVPELVELKIAFNQLSTLQFAVQFPSLAHIDVKSNEISTFECISVLCSLKLLKTVKFQSKEKKHTNPICNRQGYRSTVNSMLQGVEVDVDSEPTFEIRPLPQPLRFDKQVDTNDLLPPNSHILCGFKLLNVVFHRIRRSRLSFFFHKWSSNTSLISCRILLGGQVNEMESHMQTDNKRLVDLDCKVKELSQSDGAKMLKITNLSNRLEQASSRNRNIIKITEELASKLNNAGVASQSVINDLQLKLQLQTTLTNSTHAAADEYKLKLDESSLANSISNKILGQLTSILPLQMNRQCIDLEAKFNQKLDSCVRRKMDGLDRKLMKYANMMEQRKIRLVNIIQLQQDRLVDLTDVNKCQVKDDDVMRDHYELLMKKNQLEIKLNSSIDKIAELEVNLTENRSIIQVMQSKIDSSRSEISSAVQVERNNHSSQIKQITDEFNKLALSSEEYRLESVSATRRATDVMQDLDACKKEMRDMRQVAVDVEVAHKETCSRLNEMIRIIRRIEAMNDNLKGKLSDSDLRIEELKCVIVELRRDHLGAVNEIDRCETLVRKNNDLESSIQLLDGVVQERNGVIAQLRMDMKGMQSKLQDEIDREHEMYSSQKTKYKDVKQLMQDNDDVVKSIYLNYVSKSYRLLLDKVDVEEEEEEEDDDEDESNSSTNLSLLKRRCSSMFSLVSKLVRQNDELRSSISGQTNQNMTLLSDTERKYNQEKDVMEGRIRLQQEECLTSVRERDVALLSVVNMEARLIDLQHKYDDSCGQCRQLNSDKRELEEGLSVSMRYQTKLKSQVQGLTARNDNDRKIMKNKTAAMCSMFSKLASDYVVADDESL